MIVSHRYEVYFFEQFLNIDLDIYNLANQLEIDPLDLDDKIFFNNISQILDWCADVIEVENKHDDVPISPALFSVIPEIKSLLFTTLTLNICGTGDFLYSYFAITSIYEQLSAMAIATSMVNSPIQESPNTFEPVINSSHNPLGPDSLGIDYLDCFSFDMYRKMREEFLFNAAIALTKKQPQLSPVITDILTRDSIFKPTLFYCNENENETPVDNQAASQIVNCFQQLMDQSVAVPQNTMLRWLAMSYDSESNN